jgi:dienelactone hydrolase
MARARAAAVIDPLRRLALRAEDGTRLSAFLDGPERVTPAAALVLPGFWRRAASPRIRWLALELARRFTTLTLDFRGHGESEGRFTFGRLEHLDVEAALDALAREGVERVAVVGLSMGGAAGVVALSSGRPLAVTPAGLLTIAAPADFGRIRPRPWRGRRDVEWVDAWRVPRVDWTFPWTGKLIPEQHASRLPDIPLRFVHARLDWLVDHALGESLHASVAERGDLVVIEAESLHADELLGRHRDLMGRIVRSFVGACLAPPVHAAGEGREVDPSPWLVDLRELARDRSRHADDLRGAVPASWDAVRAFETRDGVHLAMTAGDAVLWARGLRDGSAHGLNRLATALLLDGPAWSAPMRAALEAVLADATGGAASRRHLLVPLPDGGVEVRPWEAQAS